MPDSGAYDYTAANLLGKTADSYGVIDVNGEVIENFPELDGQNRVRQTSQITFRGVNEDPSWAPDGRHLVHVGVRNYGYGLFVTDLFTGNSRTLVSGIRPNPPAWSPPLAP